MDEKYKNRVTLITYFEKEDLNKVDRLMKNIKVSTCKVPYIPDTEEERHKADIFPWHITIFIGNKERAPQILELIKKAKKQKIKLKFNDVILQQSPKFGSMSLLLTIEQNQEMIDLQNMFYHEFTEEKGRGASYKGKAGEKYDASKYTFHLTLDIDKDLQKIQDEYEIIKKDFKPFEVEFEKLMLFNDLGGSLIAIEKMGEKEEKATSETLNSKVILER